MVNSVVLLVIFRYLDEHFKEKCCEKKGLLIMYLVC